MLRPRRRPWCNQTLIFFVTFICICLISSLKQILANIVHPFCFNVTRMWVCVWCEWGTSLVVSSMNALSKALCLSKAFVCLPPPPPPHSHSGLHLSPCEVKQTWTQRHAGFSVYCFLFVLFMPSSLLLYWPIAIKRLSRLYMCAFLRWQTYRKKEKEKTPPNI